MNAPLTLGPLLAILLAAAPAQSQQESVAEDLFWQGREDMKRGDAVEACPKFAESYRLEPAIGTLLNLAFCEDSLGHTATAWSKFRQFLESAPSVDDRVAVAREKVTELESKLSRLHLFIDPRDDRTTVLLDDSELPNVVLNEAIPINPGEHVVRVRDPNGEFTETSFRIHPAENLDLHLSGPLREAKPVTPPRTTSAPTRPTVAGPPAQTTAPKEKPSQSPSHNETERAAAYGVGAVGVAGLLVSGVFGLMALRDRNFVHDQCPSHECQSKAGLDATKSGSRNATMANVALGVGTLGLMTSGILLWHSGRLKTAGTVGPNSAFISVVGSIQ